MTTAHSAEASRDAARRDVLAPDQRAALIGRQLRDLGRVRIGRLAEEFGVSDMTVRRDLDELEVLGLARRVRGGAVAVGPASFTDRHRRQGRAKARIAEKLLGIVPESGAIAMDASSTIHRLATSLEGARDLIVVSNGLDTFEALRDKPGITPVLTGGVREPRTGSLVGPVASRSATQFLYDLYLCSAAALELEAGSSEASLEEAELKRGVAACSSKIVLAVDHTKLGTRGTATVFGVDDLTMLVTDLDPGDERLRRYARRVDVR